MLFINNNFKSLINNVCVKSISVFLYTNFSISQSFILARPHWFNQTSNNILKIISNYKVVQNYLIKKLINLIKTILTYFNKTMPKIEKQSVCNHPECELLSNTLYSSYGIQLFDEEFEKWIKNIFPVN